MQEELRKKEAELQRRLKDVESQEVSQLQEAAKLEQGLAEVSRGLNRLEVLDEREQQLQAVESELADWEEKLRVAESELQTAMRHAAEDGEAAKAQVSPISLPYCCITAPFRLSPPTKS